MHFLGNKDRAYSAYSVDLAWKCSTAVCELLVVTSYSRRAAERGDVSTFLSAAGERMTCSLLHIVSPWSPGEAVGPWSSHVYHRWGPSSVSVTTVVWNVRDFGMSTLSGLAAQSVRASASGVCVVERHRFQLKSIRRFLSLDTMYCVYPVVPLQSDTIYNDL